MSTLYYYSYLYYYLECDSNVNICCTLGGDYIYMRVVGSPIWDCNNWRSYSYSHYHKCRIEVFVIHTTTVTTSVYFRMCFRVCSDSHWMIHTGWQSFNCKAFGIPSASLNKKRCSNLKWKVGTLTVQVLYLFDMPI